MCVEYCSKNIAGIPGSFKSKNDKREEVKIIQKWDGNRPSIKPLLFRLDLYLHVLKSQKLQLHKPNGSKDRTIVYSTDWLNKKRLRPDPGFTSKLEKKCWYGGAVT